LNNIGGEITFSEEAYFHSAIGGGAGGRIPCCPNGCLVWIRLGASVSLKAAKDASDLNGKFLLVDKFGLHRISQYESSATAVRFTF